MRCYCALSLCLSDLARNRPLFLQSLLVRLESRISTSLHPGAALHQPHPGLRASSNSPIMRLRRPVGPTEHPGAVRTFSRHPERRRWTLSGVRGHLGLRFRLLGDIRGGLGGGRWCFRDGDVVNHAELAALLGGPMRMIHRQSGTRDQWERPG